MLLAGPKTGSPPGLERAVLRPGVMGDGRAFFRVICSPSCALAPAIALLSPSAGVASPPSTSIPMKTTRAFVLSLVAALPLFAAGGTVAGFPRSTPEAQGLSSAAVLGFLDAAEEKIDALHSVMIVRRGHVVAEGWWAPYAAELPHQMFSLSKSFTSTAVGLAIAEGKFAVEDPVLKFFPGEAPAQPSANLRAMRVRDLLTMSTGHHTEDLQNFSYTSEESAVKRFLALPVTHKPGTFFVYNTPATYMLSAIVQQTTGETVLEYLRPRLFAPLGITAPTWEASRQGVSLGGFGLSIRTEDIARFGQLYLQRGYWQGKQLVPAAWVESATSRWMSNGSNPASDWEQGYGYQFWRCRYGVIRGDGAHGQFCVIFPDLDTVVAITAGTRDLQGVLNQVWAKLLPALQGKQAPLAPDAAAHEKLKQKLASLSLRSPVAVATPARAKAIAGKRYVFPKNSHAIESITLTPSSTDPRLTEVVIKLGGVEQQTTAQAGGWWPGKLAVGPDQVPVASSGAWTSGDTFTLDIVRTHTPFATRYALQFADDHVAMTVEPNVGPRPVAGAALIGRQQ